MFKKPGFHVGLMLMLTLLFISACSGGSDPATGSLTGGDGALTPTTHRLSVSTDSRDLWGYWHVAIDPETHNVEIIPLRGLMFHVNAVEWMQPPAGSLANLGVKIVYDGFLTEGRFDIDVTLTHPFAGLNQFTGWDVMGVYITDGHQGFLNPDHSDISFSDGGVQDSALLNPDGYTRWWNQDEFDDPDIRIFAYIPGAVGANAPGLDANINPYKYFTEGIGSQDAPGPYLAAHADHRGVFPAGAKVTRRYMLKWPMIAGVPQFEFDYAVVASWVPPTVNPPVDVFVDFPITANAPEPVALSISDESTFWYSEVAGTKGGELHLEIEAYCFASAANPNGLNDTIESIIIEFLDSAMWPLGETREITDPASVAIGGTAISSIYQVDFTNVPPPSDDGAAPVMIILQTPYNYDSGFGTNYPVGAPLSSYFYYALPVSPYDPGADVPPQCEDPVPEYTERNVVELEIYTANIWEPQGDPYNIDWSVEPAGNPPVWQTMDTDEIMVNWWNVVTNGNVDPPPTTDTDWDVCVRVYDKDGENSCCVTVTVSPAPTISADPPATPNPQPDQGGQPCDLTVADIGTGSRGEIMWQDDSLGEVRMYRFNDSYSAPTLIMTLGDTGYPAPVDNPTVWNDYHKFDVTHTGQIIHLTSANPAWPSIPPDIVNDPYHCFVMPYWNTAATSQVNYLSLFGDGSSGSGDPDNLPWKQMVDWTSGVSGNSNTCVYGLFVISDQWLPNHPSEDHPGTIYVAYSSSPYNNPATDLGGIGLPTMSSQNEPVAGPIDDTDGDLMALGMDDENWWEADWLYGSGEWLDDVTVWYILDSNPTPSERKVHMVLLPKNWDDPTWDIFYSIGYIGSGSEYDVDFQGGTPVDLEVVYSAKDASGLDHRCNWLAVLVDTGSSWRVDVFRLELAMGSVVPVVSYESTATADPTALDVDTTEHEVHVLAQEGPTYQVTVLNFVP
jgi:hypothetical protein